MFHLMASLSTISTDQAAASDILQPILKFYILAELLKEYRMLQMLLICSVLSLGLVGSCSVMQADIFFLNGMEEIPCKKPLLC